MKRISWLLCVCTLLMGCEEATIPREPVTSQNELRLPADLAISEKELDEPLSEDEVLCFIDLVKSLPGGKPPEFAPVPGHEAPESPTPEESVEAWRSAVREALTVDTLMQGWAPRSPVRRALNEHRITPRALTSLMLRLSSALAAEGMGGSRMVAAQRVIADEKVEALIQEIHLHQRLRTKSPEPLLKALEEAAALAEYLAILSSVPAESQQLVAEHRTALKQMLPVTSGIATPTESLESNRIMPVSFEEPAQPTSSRRREKTRQR